MGKCFFLPYTQLHMEQKMDELNYESVFYFVW